MTLQEHQRFIDHFRRLFGDAELIDTHISSVLLTPAAVYKFKKPVDFGFLDYSTLARRKHFCAEEIRLGRLGAPGLYDRVVSVYGSIDAPTLEPQGVPIAHAVRMRRFEERLQLDNLLQSGKLEPSHMDAVAVKLAAFHRTAAVADAQSGYGTPAAVLQPMLENIEHLDILLGPEDARQIRELHDWITREHARRTPMIAARKAEGFVRECHGDLHLRNMALFEGDIIFFDPIEFSETLRRIDVISDLAFLLMDLDARGKPDYSGRTLNRYLEESGDYDAVPLLPLYKVYRAMVRAKVAALRLAQQTEPSLRRQIVQECRHYLELAASYRHKPEPFLLLMNGVSGSGKSVAALQIAEHTGALRLRSDRERLRQFGSSEQRYGTAATEATYARLERIAHELLNERERVIVDAAALQKTQRERFRRLAKQCGVPFRIVRALCPEPLLFERLARRAREQNDISEATAEVLRHQLAHGERPGADEAPYTSTLHTGSAGHLAADLASLYNML